MSGARISDYNEAGTPKGDDGAPAVPQSAFMKFYSGPFGVVAGAVLGIAIGAACNSSHPSEVVTSWVGILGTLFINAIKCLVAPVVFCSLVVGMADMLAVGKAGTIGWRAAVMYVLTSVLAAIEGLIWVSIFRNSFSSPKKANEDKTPKFAFGCPEKGEYLTSVNGMLECVVDKDFESSGKHQNESIFMVEDINSYFALPESEFAQLTVSEALQGQLKAMVPENITEAFANATLLSIVMFAMPFGVAIAALPSDMNLLASFFREVYEVFMKMIQWVIVCTPIALISLLAGVIMKQHDLAQTFSDVGIFVLCSVIGIMCHLLVVYPTLLLAFARINPLPHMRAMVPAMVFSFSCASSMATLPVTMRCVDSTKKVSKALSRFVLSLGATINMDGAALCYPINIVFMAEASGQGHLIGTVEYIMIIIVSTVGAVGAGPVPSASIVMTMTIWSSVFPDVALPSTFAFIVATDWLLDRFHTATNVTGDTIISRIIAKMVGEDHLEEEELGAMSNAIDRVSERYSSYYGGKNDTH